MTGSSNYRNILAGVGVALTVLFCIVLLTLSGRMWESVDADEIVVIQDPIDGELHWYTTQGLKWQNFGSATTYQKRDIYEIAEARVRFNDGGHGTIHGSIQFDMPLDVENLTALHTRYGSSEAIKDQVIKRTVDKVIYMTGPLMSSRESYAEKRTDLINYVQDQLDHGVYKVVQRTVETTDQLSGQKRTAMVAEIVTTNTQPQRQEHSIVGEFGIRAFNFAITELKYDEQVEKQIQQQQQLTMDVQTAQAEARKAEQRRITTEQQGQASAATAKWEQEVIKAKEVTAAEQRLRVAELEKQTAEQYRQSTLLKADADSTYRRKMMEADNALQQRLDAAIKINQFYADAIKNHAGPWVPNVVMGTGQSGTTTSGAQALIDLLTAQTAKQVGLQRDDK